ncbi:hypothetical protein BpHYR1_035541 [Brachionus plicatilis]|uniref:Uncharacterized protein n=1 Tax=Brachionus plicatilis TaxID=10195 RepID=A0A3M7R8Z7_BRAPC|nr:hypothetical protein BpHYR1_035541 [Brachionus plicatilis]
MQLGFYHPQGGIIYSKQKYLDHCRKIKRYTLNEKDLLIVIRDSIVLNEKKNADEIIEWQLFKNRIYDEENDKLLFFAALKNALFYVTILSIGKHLGNQNERKVTKITNIKENEISLHGKYRSINLFKLLINIK